MALSDNIITQFVKATKDNTNTKKESTVYGEVVIYNGFTYVKLDGSDQLTPVTTTVDAKDGDRVIVMLKDHRATVTGSTSSPSARLETVTEIDGKIVAVSQIISHKIEADELSAVKATIDSLNAKVATIGNADITKAIITELEAKYANVEYLSAKDIEAINATITNLTVEIGKFTDVSTETLDAIYADIDQLTAYNAEFTYVSAERLSAAEAEIKRLDTEKITAKDADIVFANINFANIDEAVFRKLYSESGIIRYITTEDGTFTGHLVGVTISGDLIEGNTIKAEKLVVKGEDGLYYKLNIEGGVVVNEQLPKEEQEKLKNGLHGSVIIAKSITAEKVSVSDLVAFNATIAGFNIANEAIYSGVKESIDNTTSGIFLGKDGQVAFGDGTNYVKYYKDENGNYRLAVSADVITFGGSGKNVEEAIDDIEVGGRNLIRNSTNMIFADYYFYEPGETDPDPVVVTATWDDEGNVELHGATATHDGNGNVTLIM